MPMIKSIRALPYNVPLKSALTWGSGHVLPNLQHVLVSVELSDGAVGIAEATPRPSIYGETQVSVIHIVERHLAPRLLGNEVARISLRSRRSLPGCPISRTTILPRAHWIWRCTRRYAA